MLYIDTCSYDDFDRVIRFLLKHEIIIVERDKMRMQVAVEMSEQLFDKMRMECDFEAVVTKGETPLFLPR